MSSKCQFVAADLGASTGRIMLGQWDGERFSLQKLHRFANGGVSVGTNLYWDALGISSHLQEGLQKYRALFQNSPSGIGVDAWGVDFGLLDQHGRLIGNPRHYRDTRTNCAPESLFKVVPESEVFAETGTQTMEINTLFQFYCMVQENDPHLKLAETLLLMPDLFNYFLSGEKAVEYTEATTTQMYSQSRRAWARELLNRCSVPVHLLPEVVFPGTILSDVQPEVLRNCGFGKAFPVIAVASHDTASAVAAIPNMDVESAFISSGTWSLMGVEVSEPNTSSEALRLRFTNEGGADGKNLLLKNITGLWILQECLQQWKTQGADHDWNDIVQVAGKAKALQSIFDPNDKRLHVQSDMPRAIQGYCRSTRQPVPETMGEIARCAFESLSLKCRSALESLESLTGRTLKTIRVVGGGSLNTFLCQTIADTCNRPVVAGPVEASALGNVMLQAIATGHLSDIQSGRAAIAASVQCVSYHPRPSGAWDEAYARFKLLEAD